MGDLFDIKVLGLQNAVDAMSDMTKRTDRATMWALREVGRQVKREARRRAPVYKGRRAVATHREVKALYKAGATGSIGNVVVSGLLKNSISSSRRLKAQGSSGWSLKVGPRGERAHLYAGKIEAQRPYMRPAYEAVLPSIVATHAKAWERAMNSGKK